jgi:autophagy-related protein 17
MNGDTDSEESSSSDRSVSPSTHSFPPKPPPSLQRLIQHYASAKQALSSTQYVWRANQLVTSARDLIEEIAVLNARNEYLCKGAEGQVDILYDVKAGLEKRDDEVGDDFQTVVEDLDRANGRLQTTLNRLRETIWKASLRGDNAPAPASNAVDSANVKKTLYDFVDASAHDDLLASLRADIDSYHASHNDFTHSLGTFDNSIKTIGATLSRQPQVDFAEKRTLYDAEPPPTIRDQFEGIEEHAGAMAELLQGLVKHFDLCVSALKHTEGGGQAAKQVATVDGNDEQGPKAVEESLYLRKIPLPISDEERQEMLIVLERDAAELEDVTVEIRDRHTEQETLHSQLLQLAAASRERDTILREVMTMLREMRDLHLHSHLHALQTFEAEWSRIRESMTSKTATLLELASSNEGFIQAYAELLKEVQRRDVVKQKMSAVADKARKELQRLRDGDEQARREFMEEFGGSLPKGIWDGELNRVGQQLDIEWNR